MSGDVQHPFTLSFQVEALHSSSISFGRFELESLSWERRSSFSRNRYLEDVEKYAKPGSVTEKKAQFEAHFKKRALLRQASTISQAEREVSHSDDSSSYDASICEDCHRRDSVRGEDPRQMVEDSDVCHFDESPKGLSHEGDVRVFEFEEDLVYNLQSESHTESLLSVDDASVKCSSLEAGFCEGEYDVNARRLELQQELTSDASCSVENVECDTNEEIRDSVSANEQVLMLNDQQNVDLGSEFSDQIPDVSKEQCIPESTAREPVNQRSMVRTPPMTSTSTDKSKSLRLGSRPDGDDQVVCERKVKTEIPRIDGQREKETPMRVTAQKLQSSVIPSKENPQNLKPKSSHEKRSGESDTRTTRAVTPQPRRAVTPQTKRAVTPQSNGPVTPQPRSAVMPQMKRAATPQPRRPVTPQPRREVMPQTKRPVTPQSRRPVTPQPRREVTPQTKRAVTPQPRRPVTPQPRREVTPQPRRPVTPQPRRPVTPQTKRAVTPQPRRPVTPQPRSVVTPQTKRAVTPQPRRTVTPQPKRAVTPRPSTPERSESLRHQSAASSMRPITSTRKEIDQGVMNSSFRSKGVEKKRDKIMAADIKQLSENPQKFGAVSKPVPQSLNREKPQVVASNTSRATSSTKTFQPQNRTTTGSKPCSTSRVQKAASPSYSSSPLDARINSSSSRSRVKEPNQRNEIVRREEKPGERKPKLREHGQSVESAIQNRQERSGHDFLRKSMGHSICYSVTVTDTPKVGAVRTGNRSLRRSMGH